MENQEKLTTYGTQDEEKQNKSTKQYVLDTTINKTNSIKWIRNKGNNKFTELEQSSKGKVKTHKYINRQNQSTTGKLGKP